MRDAVSHGLVYAFVRSCMLSVLMKLMAPHGLTLQSLHFEPSVHSDAIRQRVGLAEIGVRYIFEILKVLRVALGVKLGI